jgi:carboxyl-terminal processing protease
MATMLLENLPSTMPNGKKIKKSSFDDYHKNFTIDEKMLQSIIKKGEDLKIDYKAEDFEKSKSFIQSQVKALIARSIWKDENGLSNSFYRVIAEEDKMLKEAVKHFDKAKSLGK